MRSLGITSLIFYSATVIGDKHRITKKTIANKARIVTLKTLFNYAYAVKKILLVASY